MQTIPFNKPYMTGKELWYIAQAHANGHLAGDGIFTQKCQQWLITQTGALSALLTNSCTAALEMSAILADIKPGDEVIMPSYTASFPPQMPLFSEEVYLFLWIYVETHSTWTKPKLNQL